MSDLSAKEILRLRKKLCLDLAEDVLDLIGTSPIDPDEIARVIDGRLPLTYAELEAEAEEFEAEEEQEGRTATDWRDNPDSIMSRMCAALGLSGKEHDLKTILEAAIERISKQRA